VSEVLITSYSNQADGTHVTIHDVVPITDQRDVPTDLHHSAPLMIYQDTKLIKAIRAIPTRGNSDFYLFIFNKVYREIKCL